MLSKPVEELGHVQEACVGVERTGRDARSIRSELEMVQGARLERVDKLRCSRRESHGKRTSGIMARVLDGKVGGVNMPNEIQKLHRATKISDFWQNTLDTLYAFWYS